MLIDFSNVQDGEKVHLINTGSTYEPFKGLNPDGTVAIATATTSADPVSQIMEFRVVASKAAFHSTMTSDTVLNPDYKPIEVTSDTITRKLGVFEYADQFGRIMPVVGIAEDAVDQTGAKIAAGGLGWAAPATEIIKLGATEIWEFYNVTADAHPIHIHQVQFQVLGRYEISSSDANGDGIILQGEQAYQNDLGAEIPLHPEDLSNQDTVWLGPGEALKVIATFDRPGDYVWHCHILSHEDNDMMRPIKVIGFCGDTTGMVAEDSVAPAGGLLELGTLDNALQGFQAGPIVGRYGTLLLNQDGNWSYAVDNANPLVQSLGQGETVDDILTVTELDDKTTHEITVEVIGREDAPTGALSFSAHDNVDSVLLTANQSIFDLDLASQSNILGKVDPKKLSYSWQIASGAASAQMAGASAVIASTTGSLVSLIASYDDGTQIESLTSAVSNLIVGSSNSGDALTGEDKSDGNGGTISDVIFGLNGNDVITGGSGSDILDGGAGSDVYIIGATGDHPAAEIADSGTSGADELRYTGVTAATLTLFAGDTGLEAITIGTGAAGAADTTGTSAIDVDASTLTCGVSITGNAGANNLTGGAGDDRIIGFIGADTINGGSGADTLILTATAATLNAAADAQLLSVEAVNASTATAGVTITLANQSEGFLITGSATADALTGGSGADSFISFAGADTIDGGGGIDTLVLTATSTTLNSATDGRLTNLEAVSASTAVVGVTIKLANQTEGFVITGGAFADALTGGVGADTFIGSEGADTINGGGGVDTLFLTATSTDLNNASNTRLTNVEELSASTAATGVNINLATQTEGFAITGSAFADTLTSGSGADTFIGFAGADTINGGSGTDTLVLTGTSTDLNTASNAQLVNLEAVSASTAATGVVITLFNQT